MVNFSHANNTINLRIFLRKFRYSFSLSAKFIRTDCTTFKHQSIVQLHYSFKWAKVFGVSYIHFAYFECRLNQVKKSIRSPLGCIPIKNSLPFYNSYIIVSHIVSVILHSLYRSVARFGCASISSHFGWTHANTLLLQSFFAGMESIVFFSRWRLLFIVFNGKRKDISLC